MQTQAMTPYAQPSLPRAMRIPSLATARLPVTPAANDAHPQSRTLRFESLIAPHREVLSRVAFRLCGHRETAEDLVQETLTRAWARLDQLREPTAAKAWAFMILRNEHARTFQRRALPMVELEPDLLADEDTAPCEDEMALHEAVEALPESYRIPLVMAAFGGHELCEIASHLCIKTGTVKTRLFRARQMLRTALTASERVH